MDKWYWTESLNKHGKPYWNGSHPCGLECYIQMSTFAKFTSTTLWQKGKRKKTDRWLHDERTKSFDEAKRWLDARDPWDVYNDCKPRVATDETEPKPKPKPRQLVFFGDPNA
jgi:hypothetical protein